jgi:hypothetical protein
MYPRDNLVAIRLLDACEWVNIIQQHGQLWERNIMQKWFMYRHHPSCMMHWWVLDHLFTLAVTSVDLKSNFLLQ